MRCVAAPRLLQLGDHLLDRAARGELHDDEIDGDDAEQRRDHQQQPPQQIGRPSAAGAGGGRPSSGPCGRAWRRWRRRGRGRPTSCRTRGRCGPAGPGGRSGPNRRPARTADASAGPRTSRTAARGPARGSPSPDRRGRRRRRPGARWHRPPGCRRPSGCRRLAVWRCRRSRSRSARCRAVRLAHASHGHVEILGRRSAAGTAPGRRCALWPRCPGATAIARRAGRSARTPADPAGSRS